jgi:putative sterol carrier protein
MLSKQKINHCIGCFTCWTKTPGICIHNDDMAENLPKLQEANLIVFSTPLYIYNVTGLMKDFLDRQIPLIKPDLIEKEGKTSHPRRRPYVDQKVFLISVAGFPELSHFDALVTLFKQMYRGDRYIGEILIPGSEPMSMDDFQENYKKLYQVIEQAGFEVAKNGFISEETKKAIKDKTSYTNEELQVFREMANKYWESMLPKDYSQVKLEKTEMEPLKITDAGSTGMSAFFAGMAQIYNPKAIPGLKAVIQFELDDERFYLVINENTCNAYKGSYTEPTLTIISPKEVWMKISSGKISGASAFMKKLFQVKGDMSLIIKMNKIFSK